MKIICSWCGKTIKENSETIEISHGICKTCCKEVLKNIKKQN